MTLSALTSASRLRCGIAAATVAALALTLVEPPAALAAPAAQPGPQATPATGSAAPATDFSARRRVVRRHRGGSAAGAAFMGMALGTMGAIIADQQRRDYYRENYYYGGSPYYGGYYYGRRPYYGGYYGGGPFYPVPHY